MQLPLEGAEACARAMPNGTPQGATGGSAAVPRITAAERTRQWRLKNKDRSNAAIAKWRAAHPERVREYSRRAQSKHGRKYQPKRTLRQRERYHTDPLYRVKRICRSRYTDVLNAKGFPKRLSSFRTLGCTAEVLRDHLAVRFKPGMTWSNYGQWEIDHIRPIGKATTVQEVEALCHYTNLQPLWRPENRAKGAK